jgi:hypothetical protein
VHYRCFICHRPPRGFGWLDPDRKQAPEQRRASYKRFCSKLCQDIHYQLHRQGVAMSRTDLEQKAGESVLGPLADYVVSVGMNKGLGNYSKTEITGLVDAVLNAYHAALQDLYKDEVPF